MKKLFRWGVRLAVLALTVLFALGGPLPDALAGVIPGLSPLVLASNALSRMGWYRGLFWGGPALVVLGLAVWRGRFFCRWVCPAGTVYSIAARRGGGKRLLRVRVNGILFWSILVGAVLGAPVLLFLDPLSSASRLTPFANGAGTVATLIPGLVVPAFLLLGLLQPVVWCSHVCPLGYFFDAVRLKGNGRLHDTETRRAVLGGLVLGIPLALLGRTVRVPASKARPIGAPASPVLPPGADSAERFAATCSRCYACINACPTKVIRVKMPTNRPVDQFFLPELDFARKYPGGQGFCDEFCTRCTQTCPTGALTPLSEDKKHATQIGVAVVRRDACLAWADHEHCMVCQEYCPYLAIREDKGPDGIPRPVVDPEICRGCGFCQNQCPAIRDGVAIVVNGVSRQRQAKDFF